MADDDNGVTEDFDFDKATQELERMSKELDSAYADVEHAMVVFEKMEAEYKKYQALEKQLASNPLNADAIKREMAEIEKNVDLLSATVEMSETEEK